MYSLQSQDTNKSENEQKIKQAHWKPSRLSWQAAKAAKAATDISQTYSYIWKGNTYKG